MYQAKNKGALHTQGCRGRKLCPHSSGKINLSSVGRMLPVSASSHIRDTILVRCINVKGAAVMNIV